MEKRFRVLDSHRHRGLIPQSIPWELIEPHREQAMKNHHQSLEELDRRGGLSVDELFAVLQDRRWEVVEQGEAIAFLNNLIKEGGV